MNTFEILTPLQDNMLERLRAGDQVYITGIIFTARDAAHQRFIESMSAGKKLPFNLHGQVIYYTGPAPAGPGRVIGSAGPTTSGRMDIYTPELLAAGLKGMIGKGNRSEEVKEAMLRHRAVYFAAVGGAAALIARSIRKAEVIAYPELGAEAVHRLEVGKLPAIVVNDIYGGDLYEMGKARYAL